ncbi:PREDICTED: uncharacterized protein LOC108771149 [Trachymyrmex cornetzi]|uniref:uncharacterized protein LOC108771149 n=1 Tax=Trachymyrmex cornetzi TaxID=471704 RepID=UPI00084F463E|nr:PREDICTED: uncharacterized protein LOC108771149 [Trachymyrmex cornetzi]
MGGERLFPRRSPIPFLWCLVADRLFEELQGNQIETKSGYPMDVVCCLGKGRLLVNPNKTSLVIFTRKYKVERPVLEGVRLTPEMSVKYLGAILDKRLNWKLHSGLQPDRVLWLYSAVLRPRLLYAVVVWWPRTQLAEAHASLERVRTLILREAVGAMRTKPVAAMGVLLDIKLHHYPCDSGGSSGHCVRLKCEGKWSIGVAHTRLPRVLQMETVFEMRQDRMPIRRDFDRSFKIYLPSREDWERHERPAVRNEDVWYTDGSKTDGGAGAGIYGGLSGVREALPYGEFTTVFQSEVVAIMGCAQTLIASDETSRRIWICSDSRAALEALGAYVFDS